MFVLTDMISKGRDWVLLPLYDPGQFVGILLEGDYDWAHIEKNTVRLGQRSRATEREKETWSRCLVFVHVEFFLAGIKVCEVAVNPALLRVMGELMTKHPANTVN